MAFYFYSPNANPATKHVLTLEDMGPWLNFSACTQQETNSTYPCQEYSTSEYLSLLLDLENSERATVDTKPNDNHKPKGTHGNRKI